MGRKTKYCEKIVERICESLRLGVTMQGAAYSAGITEKTFHEWRNKHSAFSEAVTRAIGQSEESLVQIARQSNDPRVAVQLLERRFKNGWSKGESHTVDQKSTITTVNPEVLKAFTNAKERNRSPKPSQID
jgi:hypothetical protein